MYCFARGGGGGYNAVKTTLRVRITIVPLCVYRCVRVSDPTIL